jgi:hypothetical protein
MPTLNMSPSKNLDGQSTFWFLPFIIVLLFALFRLPGLGVPLASDELATVSLWAQMPYAKIFSNYQYPNNHIFLTLVLSFLLKTFGLKEWLLRMPLMICGLTSLYLTYSLGKKISGKTVVGLFIAFLMAISEQHIFFSTNARGYLVVMVLALLAVHVLLNLLDRPVEHSTSSNGLKRILIFFGWSAIWIFGTWTIPTFLFFEVSVAIFIFGLMLVGKRLLPNQKIPAIIILLSIVTGCIGFYLQYYVLIDAAMLAEATSNAAKTSLPLLLPELLAIWVDPFKHVGIIFFILSLIGLVGLYKKNWVLGLLMLCVGLGPIIIGIAGFIMGMLPGVPHSRTYFYLQPFFLILSVMGAQETGGWIFRALIKGVNPNEKIMQMLAPVLAGVLLVFSAQNFVQKIYPQRISREPLNEVHDFVQKLNSNDLLLVSNEMHVKFFLYGAKDMQNRIQNILREGRLENVYFLDYKKNNVSGGQDLESTEKHYFNFPKLIGDTGKTGLGIIKKAVEIAGQFGPFIFYQLKPGWLQPNPGWEKAGLNPASLETKSYKWEKIKSSSGIRPLIRFKDSFTVAIMNQKPQNYEASGLALNLVEVAGSDKLFSAALLGGQVKEGKIIYNPGWKANAWILSHPYGNGIFNRNWNSTVFVSQGAGNLSVMDVQFGKELGNGAMRNFLSYRIDEPEAEVK